MRWRETDARLQSHHEKKNCDPESRRERRAPVAREDGDHGAEDARRRILAEEQIAERAGVEAANEAAERSIPRALAAIEGPERAGREVAPRERPIDRLRTLEPRFHRNGDPRREDRIQKRSRVADDDPPIARIRRRAVRKVALDADGPAAIGAGHEARDG